MSFRQQLMHYWVKGRQIDIWMLLGRRSCTLFDALLAGLLPFPAGARVHLVASCNSQGQDEGLTFRGICGRTAEARLAAVWTGITVCFHLFCCTDMTTGTCCCISDHRRMAVGLLFCFSLNFLMYPQHQPGKFLYVALLLQVWEDHRPTEVNIQSELPCRNIGVSLQ